MFLDALFYYEDLVRNVYDGVWLFEQMIFIYACMWRLAYEWDLIEESEAYTDAERLRMTNLFLDLTRYCEGAEDILRGMRSEKWNCEGVPVLRRLHLRI